MDMKHPSNIVEAVSMVPSANSTSYLMLRVLTGRFNSLQNLLSTKDLSAPESNKTLAYTSLIRNVPVITLSFCTASSAFIWKTRALVFLASSGFLGFLGKLVFICPFSLQP
ncbi:hypothetical protein HanIR_Chr11g0542731 [Helianthus annuus]|nr:hypothetical protein HanIR_Chr11g0542731 [Helianthus annuus]